MRAIVLWAAISALLTALGGALFGPLGALIAAAACSFYLLVFAWLPRAAHRSFSRADYRRAARYFKLAGLVRISASARRAAKLSVCACELGEGRFEEGLTVIEKLPESKLEPGARAVWNNNVAYALARLEIRSTEAVAYANSALEKRPALPGFLHTRAIALLAAGRIEEAISGLEEAYTGDSTESPLEAERCFDLGRAWARKGEDDYACDYFNRARVAAPTSLWAGRAEAELRARGAAPSGPPTDGLL